MCVDPSSRPLQRSEPGGDSDGSSDDGRSSAVPAGPDVSWNNGRIRGEEVTQALL